MTTLVTGQHAGGGNVGTTALLRDDALRQPLCAGQAQVEAMRGDRMHAHRGITDQRRTLADEAIRVHTHQRIRLRRGHRLHPAQAVFEAGTDGLTEGYLVHRQQRLDLPRRQRDHRRCLALVERQQRHRAAVAEPLPGGVVMVALDLHAAHQHRLAEVAHLRTDAEHAAGGGEAAVSGHQQPRMQLAAVIEFDHVALRIGLHAQHLAPVEQLQAVLALHGIPRGATDQMVGYQPAQRLAVDLAAGEGQRERRAAVHHLGIAQFSDFGLRQALPQPQLLHALPRGMGQRDLTAIKGGLGQRLARLHFDQPDLQPAAGQRAREAQTCRSGADHHHVHPAHARLLPLIQSAPA